MYLANSYLKCHGTKIEIKRSLHELLGWFFVLNTRLAPLPFFKIARLIVWWRYKGASIYIGIDIIFIFLQKIFNSLSSIAENLINSLDYWEDDAYLQDSFVSNWFLFSTFSWGNTMKIQKIFQGSALDLLGGSQCPPNPQLIIAIFVQSFSQNSKKNPTS